MQLTKEQAQELYSNNKELFDAIKEEKEKHKYPIKYEDVGSIKGYYVLQDSSIDEIAWANTKKPKDRNVCRTEAQAISYVAGSMLGQLMFIYNDKREVIWNNQTTYWCISPYSKNGVIDLQLVSYTFVPKELAFYEKTQAELFLKNFKPLIKQLYYYAFPEI